MAATTSAAETSAEATPVAGTSVAETSVAGATTSAAATSSAPRLCVTAVGDVDHRHHASLVVDAVDHPVGAAPAKSRWRQTSSLHIAGWGCAASLDRARNGHAVARRVPRAELVVLASVPSRNNPVMGGVLLLARRARCPRWRGDLIVTDDRPREF